jgi:hypothetical protein
VERRPELRASDADREQVAERLRQAMSEGRLAAEELEDRLAGLFASRTYGELERLVRDLPAPPESPPPAHSRVPARVGGLAAFTLMLAVFGMAAGGRGHAYAAAIPAGPHVHYFGPPPFMTMAAAMLVVVAMGLALCAGAGWLYSQTAPTSDA